MKIALFGGTFDPLHLGHLLIAESARQSFGLDRVIFLPTGVPPHKASPAAAARDRLAMARLAVRGNPAFQVSDWEVRQNRVVYTFEVLAHFHRQRPRQRLYFIVGSDSLRDLRQWRHGAALLKQATFLVAERPDVPWRSLPVTLRRQTRRIDWPAVPFASHALRDDIAAGRSIRYQVPARVDEYIRRHHLYQAAARA